MSGHYPWAKLRAGRKPMPPPPPPILNAAQFSQVDHYAPTRGWSWVGVTICGLSAVFVILCVRLALSIVFEQ